MATKQQKSKIQNRGLDAFPDRIDLRDWVYRPTLSMLPDQIVNCDKVPVVLNQGTEGACTGFAMAAVINFHLHNKGVIASSRDVDQVSPRMLYELARKYDEWPGENYIGSSARGTIKAWVAHGVCRKKDWPDNFHGVSNFSYDIADRARNVPGGAYYRIQHKNIRDIHSALYETGIVYATLMVHDGWDEPGKLDKKKIKPAVVNFISNNKKKTIELPVITRWNRAKDGHAVAIVGYTSEGFIIQNSWGPSWGNNGFALLPYEDWIMHATDSWVVQLGVPVNIDYWKEKGAADTTAGRYRLAQSIPLSEIRPYVVDIGNNGKLSDSGEYWTTREDIRRMFENMNQKFDDWPTLKIMLYLHGGLNDEKSVAKRIVAFKDVMIKNQIYPLHIMWETGVWETLKASFFDMFSKEDERAGSGFLDNIKEMVSEVRDKMIELTTSRIGTMMWDEMKENARLASYSDGGMKILCEEAANVLSKMQQKNKAKIELHIVGHSAGSIFTAYSIEELIKTGIPIKSIQFMAPAITIDLFKEKLWPHIKAKTIPFPVIYNLTDEAEQGDTVGPYGKSLLYLVSNAFEPKRETAILGMDLFMKVDPELRKYYKSQSELYVLAPTKDTEKKILSKSTTHGGFDNDSFTLNNVMKVILNKKPKDVNEFTSRDIIY